MSQIENTENLSKIQIPPYAKIKVYWDDKPENYTREGRNKVSTHFSRKYGVNKNNVNVVFRPVKIADNGTVIEITGAGIDNIMDINYQRALFKEWLDREQKTIDFDRIVKLDEKVNGSLNIDLNDIQHRKWEIKWLMIDNFLCFGNNNYANFSKLKGLNIVTSEPTNQGGKTTFTVDSIKFLLFGKTTKTDKNEEIFNQFTDGTTLTVRGMINYDDKDIIIERTMSRSAKRNGGWNIKNKLTYYKLMPDGEEIPMEEEDATSTTSEIKKTIGSEYDFDITVLATGYNLEDLIDSTPTESGKLLTKFIGLEVIEMKEEIVRKMHNEFSKSMKSNSYNVNTLEVEIGEHKEKIEELKTLLTNQNTNLNLTKDNLVLLNNKKDILVSTKKNVDITISQLNPSKIDEEIKVITEKGKTYSLNIEGYEGEIKLIDDVDYDETKYFNLTKEYNSVEVEVLTIKSKITTHKNTVDQLKNGEICPTCKRNLEDVDHSSDIKREEIEIDKLTEKQIANELKLVELKALIDSMSDDKKKVDQRNKLELQKDRAEVEIIGLRNTLKEKKIDLKKYKDNEDAINHNLNVDAEIESVKTTIVVTEREKDECVRNIQNTENLITNNETQIIDKTKIIEIIKKEDEVDKIFKIYVEMIGKKGISKLVLRSILPIINSELYRLMDDVCDFEIELTINVKNEVEFVLHKDGIAKPLKSGSGLEKTISSLALRCVLGKMSHLPTPNFISFDEVLGKISNENIEKTKPMFDKIRDMFDIVFLITHNDLVKDWGDNIITIKKTNNISQISIK